MLVSLSWYPGGRFRLNGALLVDNNFINIISDCKYFCFCNYFIYTCNFLLYSYNCFIVLLTTQDGCIRCSRDGTTWLPCCQPSDARLPLHASWTVHDATGLSNVLLFVYEIRGIP